ncbi:unknown [Prevotella sp. CAG:1185]|nr:unknown [Prevotella sp. CAG:1185]
MIIKIVTCFKTVNNFAVLSETRKGHVTGKI